MLYYQAMAFFQLIIGRGCADVDGLAGDGLKFVEGEGAVVGGGWEAESVLDKRFLAGMVPAKHGPDLGEGDVAFVDEAEEIVREIVDEGEGTLAWLAAVEVSGIILHSGAIAHLLYHLHVVFHPLFQAFRFKVLAFRFEIGKLLYQVLLDLGHGLCAFLLGGDKVLGRVEVYLVQTLEDGAGYGVDEGDSVNLVPKEFYSYRVVRSAQENVHRVPAYPEAAALEIRLRAIVEGIYKLVQEAGHAHGLALLDGDRLVVEIVRIAYAVEAADRAYDYDVPPPGHQCRCRADAEFIDLVVDGKVLFNIGIRNGDVGFRLIVIVIGNEILYGIVREKRFEFSVQLRGQGFVVA